MKYDLGTSLTNGVDFDAWRGHGHDNKRLAAQLPCRKGDTLGMVACRGGNNAFRKLDLAELRHFVVSAAQLERKDGLTVFALEQDLAAKPSREVGSRVEVGFNGDVVHPGRKNSS